MAFYKYGDLFVKIVAGDGSSLFRTLAILLKSVLLLRVMISYCRCKTIVYVTISTIIKSVAI
jgi:dolichol kinase